MSMTEGRTMPLIFRFTLPLLLGNLLQQAYSMFDAAIVGQTLGINALAAVGASSAVIFLFLGFCNGCACGFSIPVAQKFGAMDYSTMRRYVQVSYRLGWGISLILAVVTTLLCDDILRWMKTPDLIFRDAYLYLFFTFIGIPFTLFYNLLSSIIRALGDSKTPFYFLLFSTLLNVALDFFAILVLHWGVAGVSIATAVSQATAAMLCYFYMHRKYEVLHTEQSERKFSWKLASRLLWIGVPMGLQFSITAIGSIILQSANNALGTACVAAYTAALRLKLFFMCPFESLGIAMAMFAGQNYGAGKPQRVLQGVKSSVVMMLLYALFICTLMGIYARDMAVLFIDKDEAEILDYAAQFLHVSCIFFPILGVLFILRYTIQGVGFTSLAMLSGVSEMIARVLVGVWAVPVFHFTAVCYADPAAWVFADMFLIPAFIWVYRLICRRPSREASV